MDCIDRVAVQKPQGIVEFSTFIIENRILKNVLGEECYDFQDALIVFREKRLIIFIHCLQNTQKEDEK